MSASKFTMTAYTGAVVNLGYWGLTVINTEGLYHLPQIPALADHDTTKRAGVIDGFFAKDGRLLVSGFFLDNQHAKTVIDDIQSGFPMQSSVGVNPEVIDVLEANEKTMVNGRMVTGPVTVVQTGRLMEISFVTLGADRMTDARMAASANFQGSMGEPEQAFDRLVATYQARGLTKGQAIIEAARADETLYLEATSASQGKTRGLQSDLARAMAIFDGKVAELMRADKSLTRGAAIIKAGREYPDLWEATARPEVR